MGQCACRPNDLSRYNEERKVALVPTFGRGLSLGKSVCRCHSEAAISLLRHEAISVLSLLRRGSANG